MTFVSCGECGKQISGPAKSCPDCGFPVTVLKTPEPPAFEPTSARECKLMLALGIAIVAAGIGAVLVDSPLAAVVAISVGAVTVITSILGLRKCSK